MRAQPHDVEREGIYFADAEKSTYASDHSNAAAFLYGFFLGVANGGKPLVAGTRITVECVHARLWLLPIHDLDYLSGHVDAVAVPARCLSQYAVGYKLVDIELGGPRRDFQPLAGRGVCDCREGE